jgi:hypothetical protein
VRPFHYYFFFGRERLMIMDEQVEPREGEGGVDEACGDEGVGEAWGVMFLLLAMERWNDLLPCFVQTHLSGFRVVWMSGNWNG